MKKILLTVLVLFLAQFIVHAPALADEIIDSSGNIIPCKIVTVADGLIEYKKNGCMFSFTRVVKDPVFADYVDFRRIHSNKVIVERVLGYISCKDFGGVIINTKDEIISIPWYWIKNVGLYKPD